MANRAVWPVAGKTASPHTAYKSRLPRGDPKNGAPTNVARRAVYVNGSMPRNATISYLIINLLP